MSQNPDVDRVSLDERIPPGRSISGFADPIDPNVGIEPDDVINPALVDECPENAVTDVGTGLMWRYDVPDFGNVGLHTGGNVRLSGIGLKLATFYPKVNGVISGRYSTLARLDVNTTTSVGPYNRQGLFLRSGINIDALRTHLTSHLPQEGGDIVLFPLFPTSGCFVGQSNSSESALLFSLFSMTFAYKHLRPYGPHIHMSISTINVNLARSVSWGYYTHRKTIRFPDIPYNPDIFIGSNPNPGTYGCFTGDNAQALPDYYKPIYPPSWYA